MKFSEQEVREAFFKMFNETGEWVFPLEYDHQYNSNVTESTFLEFFETLVEIAGGYKENDAELD